MSDDFRQIVETSHRDHLIKTICGAMHNFGAAFPDISGIEPLFDDEGFYTGKIILYTSTGDFEMEIRPSPTPKEQIAELLELHRSFQT